MGLSLILALAALGCTVVALETPKRDGADRAAQLAKLSLFEKAAQYAQAYHQRTGKFPSEEKIAADLGAAAVDRPSIGVDGAQEDGAWRVGCKQEDDFHPAPNDSFVLSAWNGDWFDCFAVPSAKNNLQTANNPRSGVLAFGAFGFLFAFSAWAFWPVRNSREQVS
jgi:hypothetical protein